MENSEKKGVIYLMKRFFEPARTNTRYYVRYSLVSSTFFLSDVYTVLFLAYSARSFQAGTIEGYPRALFIYGSVFLLTYVLKWFVKNYTWVTTKRYIPKYLAAKYYTKYLELDNTYVEKVGTGRSIEIIKGGIMQRMDSATEVNFGLTELVVKLSLAVYLISQMGVTYLFAFVFCIFILFWGVSYFDGFANHRRRLRKENEIDMSRLFVRIIQSKNEILGSNKVAKEISESDDLYDVGLEYNKKVNSYLFAMFNLPLFCIGGMTLVILVYSYNTYLGGNFDFGLFTGLSALIGYLTQLMLISTRRFQEFTKKFIHIQKLWDFFDEAPKIQGYENGSDYVSKNGNISLRNLSFSYDDDVIFDDFSVEIEGGEKIALVGVSGSGKTTLIKLIAGYLRPNGGSISVDNQYLPGSVSLTGDELDHLSLKSYYQHIGYLTQEPSVFDGTIWENLTYSLVGNEISEVAKKNSALSKSVDEAIKNSKCEFIYDFQHGLDTEIGERGIRLSGGQRQRLAIAKIFLKDPEILILDEPTSALDSFSEEAITQAMHTLFEGRTVIIIAHRLQTVKNADDIILLEAGKIIERGTHDELVAKGGDYAKMLELQSGF